jgi:hypothetical protein
MPTQRYQNKEVVELILFLLTEKPGKACRCLVLTEIKEQYFSIFSTQTNRRIAICTEVIKFVLSSSRNRSKHFSIVGVKIITEVHVTQSLVRSIACEKGSVVKD